MGKIWGKDEEHYHKNTWKYSQLYGIFCEIILCDYCFSSYILSSVFMWVGFLCWRLVKLQNFVLRLLDDKPLTSNINELQLLPFDSIVYPIWNDQWLKSVFHLSDFNPFHLNTNFSGPFQAQQRRRRNHGHRQGLSLRLREEEMLEKIRASKLCDYSSWGSIRDLWYYANKQWTNQICWNVLWIKRLNLSLWGRRKCFYLTRKRMLGAAWICAVGLWGYHGGYYGGYAHDTWTSKILRTMTMIKTDSTDSQDSNSSNKSKISEMEWMIPSWSFNHNNILTQLMLILSYSFHIQYFHLFL